MFQKQCVESRPVVPIQQQWLDAIVARVPPQLREGPGRDKLLQELCEEVSTDYLNAIVEHTGLSFLDCFLNVLVRVCMYTVDFT